MLWLVTITTIMKHLSRGYANATQFCSRKSWFPVYCEAIFIHLLNSMQNESIKEHLPFGSYLIVLHILEPDQYIC